MLGFRWAERGYERVETMNKVLKKQETQKNYFLRGLNLIYQKKELDCILLILFSLKELRFGQKELILL